MKVEYFKEYSYNLNRDMEFKVYGHAGKPCIAFPCQDGRFFDYESRGLIDSVSWYIEQGKIQIFCVDSVDIDTWSAKWKNPRDRILYQECYYRYIIDEFVPRVYQINTYGNGGGVASGIMAFGCSMGAYHSLNFFLRRPDIFDAVLPLSGIFRAKFFFNEYSDHEVFLNSPVDSLKAMSYNHHYVDLYKRARIIICVGQGNWEEECIIDTRDVENEFKRLGVPAWVNYWGYDVPHDWPSWLEQAPHYFYHILD